MNTLKDRFLAQNPNGKLITVKRFGDNSETVIGTGLCVYDGIRCYFLSDDRSWDGAIADNKHGYKYSWFICRTNNSSDSMHIADFQLESPCPSFDVVPTTIQFLTPKKFEL